MKIAIVDIETTGFSPIYDCIVEIGISELCLETGARRIIYDKRVREKHYSERHRNSWIFANSDLNHEDIMNAEPLNPEELNEIFSKYKVTAYNKKFDFDFLKHRGFIFEELPCPMLVATNVCKIPSSWGRGYKWPKVTEAYKILIGDSEYEEMHRGAKDAMDEALIVWELYKRGEWNIL